MNCGQVTAVENGDTGWVNAFGSAVSSFPIVGGIVGGMVGSTHSLEQIQCLPGKHFDSRSGYDLEGKIAVAGILLIVAFVAVSIFKK